MKVTLQVQYCVGFLQLNLLLKSRLAEGKNVVRVPPRMFSQTNYLTSNRRFDEQLPYSSISPEAYSLFVLSSSSDRGLDELLNSPRAIPYPCDYLLTEAGLSPSRTTSLCPPNALNRPRRPKTSISG